MPVGHEPLEVGLSHFRIEIAFRVESLRPQSNCVDRPLRQGGWRNTSGSVGRAGERKADSSRADGSGAHHEGCHMLVTDTVRQRNARGFRRCRFRKGADVRYESPNDARWPRRACTWSVTEVANCGGVWGGVSGWCVTTQKGGTGQTACPLVSSIYSWPNAAAPV